MKRITAFVLALALVSPFASAAKVSRIFSNGMILQRGKPIPVWGTGKPNEQIEVTFKGQTQKVRADRNGKWRVTLRQLSASDKPESMTIKGAENTAYVHNILVGEVFIFAGERGDLSTVLSQTGISPEEVEVADTEYALIREFSPRSDWASEPQDDCEVAVAFGQQAWKQPGSKTVRSFAAFPFFFARRIQQEIKDPMCPKGVPVGVILLAPGGTPIEAWLPRSAFAARPAVYGEYLAQFKKLDAIGGKKGVAKQSEDIKKRLEANRASAKTNGRVEGNSLKYKEDAALAAQTEWTKPEFADRTWKSFPPEQVRLAIEHEARGAFRYRTRFEIPAEGWPLNGAQLAFYANSGQRVFVNGTELKKSGTLFAIPDGVLHAGVNVFAMRHFRNEDTLPFAANALPRIIPAAAKGAPPVPVIELKNPWCWTYEEQLPALTLTDPFASTFRIPGGIYNAMVAPCAPFACRGIVWWQGLSNGIPPGLDLYRNLFSDMIMGWRKAWNGELPFFYMQLTPFGKPETNPNAGVNHVVRVRKAQDEVARGVRGVAMVSGLDVQFPEGKNAYKSPELQVLAARMANSVLTSAFRMRKPCTYPRYAGAVFTNDFAMIKLDGTKVPRTKDNAAPRGFAVAGHKKGQKAPPTPVYKWATVQMQGNVVRLTSPDYDVIDSVRYAWSSNPNPNLVNELGLPLIPFTAERKKEEPQKP